MPLLGQAAMLLCFDVVPEAVAEHDDWHTHEHLHERLSIPGFLRGTRWVALRGAPRYFVMYEVAALDTLTSEAYLERLNNPSPWTSKIMPHYRGMRRGFCSITGSFGSGLGPVGRLMRFKPQVEDAARIRTWLLHDVLPELPSKRGLGSVHLLEGAMTPPMTNEQRIRGVDAGIDWALLLTGYAEDGTTGLSLELERWGVTDLVDATYTLHYSLLHQETAACACGTTS